MSSKRCLRARYPILMLKLIAVATLLQISVPASAQIITVKLPGAAAILPMKLPSVSIGALISVPTLFPTQMPLTPVSLPSHPVPMIVPMRLPGVPSSFPLPMPVALAAYRLSAPNVDHLAINWSGLHGEDDALSPALIPVEPGPQPLPPAGALNELRDAAAGREPIRVVHPNKAFDGRRETTREVALPADRFF